MLAPGDLAPDFEAPTSDGTQLKLSSLRGAPVVVYFFPKAGTAGCTRESLGFAHLFPSLAPRGVRVVGVSVDDLDHQQRFAENCSLPFPLVADPGKEIARRYGVLGAFGLARRVTFLLDKDLRVTDVVESFLPGPHVQRVRLRLLADPAPPPH
ncbi:MAG TPA: peroxiredoxin [Thermoplasmata archaeon]|nr:peroxiredoxin [Thermoplasmata archaeon]